jgi:hypothetical protein
MTQSHRLRLVLALAVVGVVVAAVGLWLSGALSGGSSNSPLYIPMAQVSPFPTPAASDSTATPPAWTGGGVALVWVALGIVLALGVAFVILRWYRRAA